MTELKDCLTVKTLFTTLLVIVSVSTISLLIAESMTGLFEGLAFLIIVLLCILGTSITMMIVSSVRYGMLEEQKQESRLFWKRTLLFGFWLFVVGIGSLFTMVGAMYIFDL